jgi:hypothetical protein
MPEFMDVVGSLRKIARELNDLHEDLNPTEIIYVVEGAAFMVKWIADGLEQELILAAKRGIQNRMKEIEGR